MVVYQSPINVAMLFVPLGTALQLKLAHRVNWDKNEASLKRPTIASIYWEAKHHLSTIHLRTKKRRSKTSLFLLLHPALFSSFRFPFSRYLFLHSTSIIQEGDHLSKHGYRS